MQTPLIYVYSGLYIIQSICNHIDFFKKIIIKYIFCCVAYLVHSDDNPILHVGIHLNNRCSSCASLWFPQMLLPEQKLSAKIRVFYYVWICYIDFALTRPKAKHRKVLQQLTT